MTILRRVQWFCLGVGLTLGSLSWLSLQFGGVGHIPPLAEIPGIALTTLLDRVPPSLASSFIWPEAYFEKLEGLLDYYQCPQNHEFRVEIVHHSPVILRFRGFLPHGEANHMLKLA